MCNTTEPTFENLEMTPPPLQRTPYLTRDYITSSFQIVQPDGFYPTATRTANIFRDLAARIYQQEHCVFDLHREIRRVAFVCDILDILWAHLESGNAATHIEDSAIPAILCDKWHDLQRYRQRFEKRRSSSFQSRSSEGLWMNHSNALLVERSSLALVSCNESIYTLRSHNFRTQFSRLCKLSEFLPPLVLSRLPLLARMAKSRAGSPGQAPAAARKRSPIPKAPPPNWSGASSSSGNMPGQTAKGGCITPPSQTEPPFAEKGRCITPPSQSGPPTAKPA